MAFQLPGFFSYAVFILSLGLIYAILTFALNIHFGYTGLLNFGHVAFFVVGAYTAAVLTASPPAVGQTAVSYSIALGLPMPWAFLVSLAGGAITAGTLALLIGVTSIRLDSHYLALATFAAASLVQSIMYNETWLTGGPPGISHVPRPFYTTLSPDLWGLVYLLIIIVVMVLVYWTVAKILDAPFGRVLKGIREDETASRMLGKPTNRFKLKSFALGGAIAGLAGALFTHLSGGVAPAQFQSTITFNIWLAMLLGGAGSKKGALLGGVAFIVFREATRFLPAIPGHPLLVTDLRWVAIGLLLIVIIRVKPAGLFGNPNEIAIGEDDGGEN